MRSTMQSAAFLDEPTVGVVPQSRNSIWNNIERLNHEGMTILYTTHYAGKPR